MLPGCGYNQVQASDEQVNAAWPEVLNQDTVAGLKATPELINDEAAFAKFQKVQNELC